MSYELSYRVGACRIIPVVPYKIKCFSLSKKNLAWLGKPQKNLFLVAGPLRGGVGLNGCATKEKRIFF